MPWLRADEWRRIVAEILRKFAPKGEDEICATCNVSAAEKPSHVYISRYSLEAWGDQLISRGSAAHPWGGIYTTRELIELLLSPRYGVTNLSAGLIKAMVRVHEARRSKRLFLVEPLQDTFVLFAGDISSLAAIGEEIFNHYRLLVEVAIDLAALEEVPRLPASGEGLVQHRFLFDKRSVTAFYVPSPDGPLLAYVRVPRANVTSWVGERFAGQADLIVGKALLELKMDTLQLVKPHTDQPDPLHMYIYPSEE